MGDIESLREAIVGFRDARDWKQFHSLGNLIVSLNLEAGELLELTQWKGDEEIDRIPADPALREALADECADVLLYLLLIAEAAGIDLHAAALAKLGKNAEKYPVEKCRGVSTKYDRLG